MFRSITVATGSPAAAFLALLQRELDRFGRDDVLLVTVGATTTFIWQPNFKAKGSNVLRRASLESRMQNQKATLERIEATLPPNYFAPFDAELTEIDPEIVPCVRKSPDEVLFDYVAQAQSLAAETSKMRIGKFLIYDRKCTPRRLAGILGLKSPMYFDGARDAHLGWPPLFEMVAGVRTRNAAAIALRNVALRSIYNISVCMAAAPYDQHRIGKLIASLAFSPQVIGHLETTYGDPVLGMTTTGGWGGSAGQYERIRVAAPVTADGIKSKLFVRTHGARVSLNYPFHLFEPAVFDAAYAFIFSSSLSARAFKDYATVPQLKRSMLFAACRLIGLPRSAIATNVVAHYFGTPSEACRAALASVWGIANPPAERSIPATELVEHWRRQQTPVSLIGVAASPLSMLAS